MSEKEAWQKRGISGVVVALNAQAREITIVISRSATE